MYVQSNFSLAALPAPGFFSATAEISDDAEHALTAVVADALAESEGLNVPMIARNITRRYAPVHAASLATGFLEDALIVYVAQSLGLLYMEGGRAFQEEAGIDAGEAAKQFLPFLRDLYASATPAVTDLPVERDALGRVVYSAWVDWATQRLPEDADWLPEYVHLAEVEKETYRASGEAVFRFFLTEAGLAQS